MRYISEIPAHLRLDRLKYHIDQLQTHPTCVDPEWFDVLQNDLEIVSQLHTGTTSFHDSSATVRKYHAILNERYAKLSEYDFPSITSYLTYLIFFVEEIRDEDNLNELFGNVSV
jgi:hypothetical protein